MYVSIYINEAHNIADNVFNFFRLFERGLRMIYSFESSLPLSISDEKILSCQRKVEPIEITIYSSLPLHQML